MKHTYPCLTAFIMTDFGLTWPKMLLSLIGSYHHKTLANQPALIGAGMSLVQIKHTYPCLTAFIMTELWPKQPKMLPSHIVVVFKK